jgi:CDGSH-type Zn-finger protein/truncated hemoglobin YjbI
MTKRPALNPNSIVRWVVEAQSLASALGASQDVRVRFLDSAVRTLSEALEQLGAREADDVTAPENKAPASADERLWELTCAVATVAGGADCPSAIDEASAALQVLACTFPPEAGTDVSARVRALRDIQREDPACIHVRPRGPLVVRNVGTITDWLGERLTVPPQVALCRCGGSTAKPFCDGTHARNAFDDAKDPKRVPDRQDIYAGQQLTVLDNRGTCAHSGFCTDGAPGVFHIGQEPFITPSGARMDEIVRAVAACPSGALGLSIGERETRERVDSARAPAIEISKDGPYRVTGGVPLVGSDGRPEPRNTGASVEHYSLCRCGHSQNKPFCSGMHWYVQFHDPVASADHAPTLFEWAGGLPALTRMTRLFYAKYVPEDPLIGPLFANMRPDHPERVAAWLGEVFGGPKNYSEQYGGYTRMVSQHMGKALTEAQRARWVSLMCQSADEARLPQDAEFRAAFVAYLEWGSRLAVENSQPGARPPANMPVPHWWWVCDATPGSRVSALQPPDAAADSPAALPGPDETVSFEKHVRPLFRQVDRQSMMFAFDLWAHEHVVRHAREILQRLENGTMPCDGAWPKERIEIFRRWLDAGTPP